MQHNVEIQMKHLLFHFQNINNTVVIDTLKRQGITGTDSKVHIFGNAWEVVRQLKRDGWIIETDRRKPSQYIFRGHYDEFDKDAQKHFLKINAVSPPPHLFRTRSEPDGLQYAI